MNERVLPTKEAVAALAAEWMAERLRAAVGEGRRATASLFPGHPQLEERQRRVAVVLDSPKPPPCRLTLTLPALERTRHVLGLVLGRGKEEAVAALRAGRDIPAARVPHALWLLDAEAGGA
jgi:6-phosphogluconolactonase